VYGSSASRYAILIQFHPKFSFQPTGFKGKKPASSTLTIQNENGRVITI
jgi:hypothetical protein